MGLGDIVSCNVQHLLEELSTYDYWLEKRQAIVHLLAAQLKALKELDGEPYILTEEDFLNWANETLDTFIEEQSDED
jgi:hypothetical protein